MMAMTVSGQAPSVPLTPEAAKVYGLFRARYEKQLEQVKKSSLVILVWGPGASGGDLYQKRVQIRDALRHRKHAAFFSEELEEPSDISAGNAPVFSVKVKEFLQAKEADFIVVIQASFGSVGEVHDFAQFNEIARKMLVFIDEQAKEGYSYQGTLQEMDARYKNVETYKDPDDIKSCRLLEKVMKKVDELQIAKWWEKQRSPSRRKR